MSFALIMDQENAKLS